MNQVPQQANNRHSELEKIHVGKTSFSESAHRSGGTSAIPEGIAGDNIAFISLLETPLHTEPQIKNGDNHCHSSSSPFLAFYQQSNTQPLETIGSAWTSQIPSAPDGDEFECVILMPHLGEVHLDAKLKQEAWHMNLSFVRTEALLLARQQSQFLSQRLQQKMEKAVVLGLSLKEGHS
ncbi:hypothetical protein [Marinomonas mediterranea]|jgi:hypothetical protein|uniref:Uncharacterized protein n=1 Tax=Marinomonas mediterranea (strain ATCC 700492 / JCM 21426 / NBRC 103028 / MMB-1) TaxID=717774 RepID=F2JTD1_MARM1|nr:hypothetical protein [Marinomonas mediterranea]ADZ90349.1 hypothetical protein Marme_1074 [Marinomonas mediterranea MMB-1]WCN16533.1 hypothetical protein GV053_05435 [Marinomonas mediterranea MMB-1]